MEVTSNSTEDYDRGERLAHYDQIPNLKTVLIVSHRRPQVTAIERTADGWQQREYRAGEQARSNDPELLLSVNELYDGI